MKIYWNEELNLPYQPAFEKNFAWLGVGFNINSVVDDSSAESLFIALFSPIFSCDLFSDVI